MAGRALGELGMHGGNWGWGLPWPARAPAAFWGTLTALELFRASPESHRPWTTQIDRANRRSSTAHPPQSGAEEARVDTKGAGAVRGARGAQETGDAERLSARCQWLCSRTLRCWLQLRAHRRAGTMPRRRRARHKPWSLRVLPQPAGQQGSPELGCHARTRCTLSTAKGRGQKTGDLWQQHPGVSRGIGLGAGEVHTHPRARRSYSPQQERGPGRLLAAGWHRRTVGTEARAAPMSSRRFSSTLVSCQGHPSPACVPAASQLARIPGASPCALGPSFHREHPHGDRSG